MAIIKRNERSELTGHGGRGYLLILVNDEMVDDSMSVERTVLFPVPSGPCAIEILKLRVVCMNSSCD